MLSLASDIQSSDLMSALQLSHRTICLQSLASYRILIKLTMLIVSIEKSKLT